MAAPVLAVMDVAIKKLGAERSGEEYASDLREARGVVAELMEAAANAKSALEGIWGVDDKDDGWIYDEMGSQLSGAYFLIRKALARCKGAQ